MFATSAPRLTSPVEMSLAVVGLDFINPDRTSRRFAMALCIRGEPVHLVRDRKNKKDPRAVAVVAASGIQLGYLTAERCGLIGRLLDAGEKHEAVFQEPGRSASIIRVRFGGGRLHLPPERPDVVPDWSEEGGDCHDWGC